MLKALQTPGFKGLQKILPFALLNLHGRRYLQSQFIDEETKCREVSSNCNKILDSSRFSKLSGKNQGVFVKYVGYQGLSPSSNSEGLVGTQESVVYTQPR